MLKPAPTPGDTGWFVHDRFGMFIHWGLYALPARHEWVKSRELIADEPYQPYFDHFDPDLYDPREWAAAAKAAGMKYVVLTAKHHEGLCLCISRSRAAGRLLLFADRLAPPRFPDRHLSPAARPARRGRAERAARHAQIRRLYAGPGARAADQLRQDRGDLVR